ncbi:hypothetical protein SNE40_002746 [Patella caerulea]|uniref:Uncharacterized protein n=1 Tax=Patella caerulea TaxID=87958 RepID=A0AAN8K6I8_PATCE
MYLVCRADIVFLIDSSDNTGTRTTTGTMYEDFYNAVDTFIRMGTISNTGIRVGAVFYNDNANQSKSIQISGNRADLLSQISNLSRIDGGILHEVGLDAANDLFNDATRVTTEVVILVTPSRSRGGVIPTNSINTLKRNSGGSTVTVYSLGVARPPRKYYNLSELDAIATGTAIELSSSAKVLNRIQEIASSPPVCVEVATTTAQPVTRSDICDDCDLKSGVGYKAHPTSCRHYIQCKEDYPGPNIIVYERPCNDGLFWNQALKNCVHFPDSDCYRGECESDASYIYESASCGFYFNCTNRNVTTQCCPEERPAFDAVTKTCVPSNTCLFQCLDLTIARNTGCQGIYRPHYSSSGNVNTCKYEVHQPNSKMVIMTCAAGTRFNSTTCSCTNYAPGGEETCPDDLIINPCDTSFDLNFGSNQIKDVAKGAWIGNYGSVQITGERSIFSGNNQQRLFTNRFSNVDFGLPLAIKLKYRDTVNRNKMAVLSTGGCKQRPGIYIAAGNGLVTIGVVTASKGYNSPFESSVNTPGINQWKEVVLYYDGTTLSGAVKNPNNDQVTQIPAQSGGDFQRILAVEGALQLGYAHDNNFPGFVGDIDDVKIWIACTSVTRAQDFLSI